LTRPGGYIAQIVPAGFYGGANAMAIRQRLYGHWSLDHLLSFINSVGTWFPAVHRDATFCLYSARKGGRTHRISVAFDIRNLAELNQALAGGATEIAVADIMTQAPQTLAIQQVLDSQDAGVIAQLSQAFPLFGDGTAAPPYRSYQRELDMGEDRDLFTELPGG